MLHIPLANNNENINTINKHPTIQINYTLPNQPQLHTIELRIDLTIDYLKLQLDRAHHIQSHTYNIYSTEKKLLAEPMSISDFKFVKHELSVNPVSPCISVQLIYSDEYNHLNNITVNDINKIDTDDELDDLVDDDLLDSSSGDD